MGLWSWIPGMGSKSTTVPNTNSTAIEQHDIASQKIKTETPTKTVEVPVRSKDLELSPFQRSRKQLTLWVAGSAFLFLTTRLALKSVARRRASTLPKFYTTNAQAMKNQEFNGAKDAFEALNIASLGVFSFGMILTGGTMFALDICNIEEARALVRNKLGSMGRKSDDEVEAELEEWVAGVLAKKEKRERKA